MTPSLGRLFWTRGVGAAAMDKQDPAARGANPGASQLSHPAMKQSADFIETRSPAPSCSRCSSRFGTSSSPWELPALRGEHRGGHRRGQLATFPPQPCPHSQHGHMFFRKVDQALQGSGRAPWSPHGFSAVPAHIPCGCPGSSQRS